MTRFQTPEPLSVTLDVAVGNVRIAASDRADTVVEVTASDETDESDLHAASQVRVDCSDGLLRVTGPKARSFDFSRRTRSVEVSIELPSGSAVSAELQVGDLRCAGRLGNCRIKISLGNAWLERTGRLHLTTSVGSLSADAATGDVEISTGSGKLRIGQIDGTAVVKNSNGDTTIETVTGDLRVRAANGDIQLGRARAGVDAKTSNGSIRLGEVVRGSVVLGTAMGHLDIGIAEDTSAWLEVDTGFGQVRNQLETVGRPDPSDRTVEVRGRTSYGDITIHRS